MAADLQTARARWMEITDALQASPAAREAVLAEILKAYQCSGRHYHGPSHIGDLLRLTAEYAPFLVDRDAIDLAVFFHDVVYSATRSDNEEASARRAKKGMALLGFPVATVEKVARYVIATKHGSGTPVPIDGDLAYFLDFDLSILGATRDAYAAYAAAIRKEYAIYPNMIFRAGRAKVLRSILEQPQIYRTEHGLTRWEAPARNNMKWELERLE